MRRRWHATSRGGLLAAALLAVLVLPAAAPGARIPDPSLEALRVAALARGVPDAIDVRPGELTGRQDLRAAVAAFYEIAVGIRLDEPELERTVRALSALSPGWRTGVAGLLTAMTAAGELRDHAYTGITPSDIAHAHDVTMRAQFAPETVAAPDAVRALATVERIDAAEMVHAMALVRAAAADARRLFAGDVAPQEPIETSFDAITIGTDRPETYVRDKQLLIDPGGDDVYLNNAGGSLSQQAFDTTGGCVFGGGTTGRASPNLGCTPLPSQVCTFDVLNNLLGPNDLPRVSLPNHEQPGSGNGHDGSCGSDERRRALAQHTADIGNDGDSRGVAALLDLGGADRYDVPWSHDDPLFGLVEFCYPGEQDRVNTNRDLFQGGSLAGISLLWDDGEGNNFFRGRLNAQGSGHVGGVAMLVSSGGGDDVYWADRLSQGNGIAGGVGVLVDTGGNNTYLLDPPIVYRNEFRPNGRDCAQEGRAGQGQGGFVGVGVLWNETDGETVYRAVVHDTAEAHPFGAIPGADGRPILFRGTDAQGSGESFPIVNTPGGIVVGTGILVDVGNGGTSVCPGAGMVEGSSYLMRAPGAIDAACGRFNVPLELDPMGDPEALFQHLVGGAIGLRVVV